MYGERGAAAPNADRHINVAFRLGVLGRLTVWTRSGEPVRLALRPRLVLATLAVAQPAVVTTEQIGDLIWGERRPASWIAQVHNVVRGLRKSLQAADPALADVVRTDDSGYRLDLPPDALDVTAFRRLVAQAGSSAAAARLDLLRAAEGLWRGPALADLRGTGLGTAAHNLDEERLTATQVRLELELEFAGRTAYVVVEAARLLTDNPWLERVHALLMTGLWRQGRGVEAADHYRRLRERLDAELGIEPAAYLRTLHSRILANDLADSGSPAAPPTPHQLPGVPADVVGRDQLVAGVVATCTGPADRLAIVALHGPPGIGKTTAALLAATRLTGRYQGGELFVRMRDAEGRSQPTAGLLGQLIAGVDPAVPIPADPAAAEGLWRTMTAGRRIVLVLDDAHDEAAVRPLLPAPGNAVVVTSIPPLPGLEGAIQTVVPALPDDVARAWLTTVVADAGDHAAALDHIVATCAGSPLALRIVAARVATHAHEDLETAAAALGSPDTALDWLVAGDLAVAKSLRYAARDLEPGVLSGLGMLAGCGFLRPAPWLVSALLGIGERQAGAVVERLAEVGLLTPEHPRSGVFGMHGLVQELARRMPGAVDDTAWRRLGALAARLARRAQQRTAQLDVTSDITDASEACARIDQDPMAWLDTNWSTLELIGRQSLVASADRAEIALATSEYCACRGLHAQSRVLVDEVIESVTDPEIVLALYNEGFGARVRSGIGGDDLVRWNEQWRGYVERHGTIEQLTAVRHRQGFAAHRAGDLTAALRHYQAALAESAEVPRLRAGALSGVGSVLSDLGEFVAAYEHCSAAVEVSRDLPRRYRAIILSGQIETAIMLGDIDAATSALAQSREQLHGLGDLSGEAHLDALEGWIRAMRGDQDGARVMLNRAHQHIDSEPDRQERAWLRLIESDVARLAGDMLRARRLAATVADTARREGDRLSEIRAGLWRSGERLDDRADPPGGLGVGQ